VPQQQYSTTLAFPKVNYSNKQESGYTAPKSIFLFPAMATAAYYTYKKAIGETKAECKGAN